MTAPNLTVARIGRWEISTAPAAWYFVPDFGLRHRTANPASNVHVNHDVLLAGSALAPYIEAQKAMLARTYDSPDVVGPQPTSLLSGQVDEAMLLLIRHQPTRGTSVLQVQTYVRVGTWIGIVTLTTVPEHLPHMRPDYEEFVRTLRIAVDEVVQR